MKSPRSCYLASCPWEAEKNEDRQLCSIDFSWDDDERGLGRWAMFQNPDCRGYSVFIDGGDISWKDGEDKANKGAHTASVTQNHRAQPTTFLYTGEYLTEGRGGCSTGFGVLCTRS
jgi:hypothetical protein